MNIYSIVSDSHKSLMNNFFLPSLQSVEPEARINAREIEQSCNGLFYSDGWHRTMEFKVDQYIEACEETWGEHFVWADIDIEFYQPFYQYCLDMLSEYDIAFQQSANNDVCAGFFIARSNENTMNFFKTIKADYNNHGCDQNAINYHKSSIKYTRLPNETIWSPLQYWNGHNTTITRKAKLAHANYVIGIQNKTMLLLKAKLDYIDRCNSISSHPKILSALYGKFEKVNNISDIKQLISSKPTHQNYLYLFDEQYQILDVISDQELES